MAYGKIGESTEYYFDDGCATADFVLMQHERPTINAVAQPDGTWTIPPQPPEFDVPVGEVDTLISLMPTIGWEILARMGIE